MDLNRNQKLQMLTNDLKIPWIASKWNLIDQKHMFLLWLFLPVTGNIDEREQKGNDGMSPCTSFCNIVCSPSRGQTLGCMRTISGFTESIISLAQDSRLDNPQGLAGGRVGWGGIGQHLFSTRSFILPCKTDSGSERAGNYFDSHPEKQWSEFKSQSGWPHRPCDLLIIFRDGSQSLGQ